MHPWMKRVIVGLLFAISALSIYLIMRRYHIGISTFQLYAETFKNFISHSYGAAVGIYMGIVALLCAMGFPLTVMLSIAAGYFFGWIGVLYAAISITLGSMALFWIARYVVGDPLQSHYSDKLGAVNHNINKNGAWYVFAMNLLPFTPAPLLAIGGGLSQMKGWSFFWSNLLGVIPQTILYVWAGNSYTMVRATLPTDSTLFIGGISIIIVFCIIFLAMKRLHTFT